jgi:diaminohydroxyphosphoribosylaminopyrimidine deaminase/5-amino-6-(5-phosphoribosylamino)uracil reductase
MSAVLTGVDTVLADDPQLNVRDPAIDMAGRQPVRVVLDSKLRTPPGARLLALPGETLIFTAAPTALAAEPLRQAGAELIAVTLDRDSRVDLHSVLQELGRRMCNDVLVEAGPTLTGRILQLGLADELIVYIAPVLLGPDARPMAGLPLLTQLEAAQRYTLHTNDRIGDDVRLVLRRSR